MVPAIRKWSTVVWLASFGALAQEHAVVGYHLHHRFWLIAWILFVVGLVVSLATTKPVLDRLPGQDDFRVWVEQESYFNYKDLALILEVKIRVRNTTNLPKQILTWKWHGRGFGQAMARGDAVEEVGRIMEHHQPLRNLTFVEPHGEITGWVARVFNVNGKPSYELDVVDEFKKCYRAKQGAFWRW